MDTSAFVLGVVTGFVSSAAAVILFGWLRSPRLLIEEGEPADGDYPHGRFRFVHVRVRNAGWKLVRWQLRRTATFCRARISFGDLGSKAPRFTIDGRWTSMGQPVVPVPGGMLLDLNAALVVPREHINPGDSADLAVAIKREGMFDCFAFNNRSYAHNWMNPDWHLEPRTYWIRVEVVSGEVLAVQVFYLVNTGHQLSGLRIQTHEP
jgi:hypothetical protein